MIEYVLAVQLNQKNPELNFQEGIQRALAGPKVVASGYASISLEQTLVAPNTEVKEPTLEQVTRILSQPYLNPDASDISKVYDDLVSRRKVLTYALNKFSADELREIGDLFKGYLSQIIDFREYIVLQTLKSIRQEIELIKRYFSLIPKMVNSEAVDKDLEQLNNQGEKLDKERFDRLFLSHDLSLMYLEIEQLMKAKGLSIDIP